MGTGEMMMYSSSIRTLVISDQAPHLLSLPQQPTFLFLNPWKEMLCPILRHWTSSKNFIWPSLDCHIRLHRKNHRHEWICLLHRLLESNLSLFTSQEPIIWSKQFKWKRRKCCFLLDWEGEGRRNDLVEVSKKYVVWWLPWASQCTSEPQFINKEWNDGYLMQSVVRFK